MKTTQTGTRILEYIKGGFFKGVGLGAGLLATSIFAAAAAMNIFSPGETLSSAKINQNFAIAAPEGAVMAFYLAGCPEGWAPADGTNGTPDLRGMFIRGRDDIGTGAGGNDPDGSRAIGALQLDAFQGHTHHNGFTNYYAVQNLAPTANSVKGLYPNPVGDGGEVYGTDSINGTPRTANESRPKNVALTYCMRKN